MMPDREKVIAWLADEELYYRDHGDTHNSLMACYALDLLKEQEAVEPKQVDLYGKDDWWGLVCVCPDCKAEWMSDKADTHFCPNCGRKVKWDD